jgi:FtsZ-binding cell division protein ZapB
MTGTLPERLARLAELKEAYQSLDQKQKEARRIHDAYQAETFEFMRENGLLTVKTDNGTFSCKSTIYSKVQDMDQFIEWVKLQELEEEFLREKEVAARLNEYVRDAVANGSPLPDGVTWYPREYISVSTDN